MKAFEKRPVLAEVLNFSAWNEPNNKAQPTHSLTYAKLAGEYWRVLDGMCLHKPKEMPPTAECHVAAGEFSDEEMPNAMAKNSEGGKYFAKYVEGTGRPTTVNRWAWHSYRDGVSTQEPGKRHDQKEWWARYKHFKKAVDTTMEHAKCLACRHPNIWLTEQGVVYFQESTPITITLARKHGTHPALVEEIFGHPKLAEEVLNAYVKSKSHEITRQGQVPLFLYYSVMGAPASFDSGLLETTETLPKGLKKTIAAETPRAIYRIYKQKTLEGG